VAAIVITRSLEPRAVAVDPWSDDRSGQLKAIVIEERNQAGVKEIEDPAPGPDDIVVKVEACGTCGTDIHVLEGDFEPTRYPIVPGH
jgi:D-arabinose 1-dehydrogenase-like Zn-dependent alcohol dehydrogenase